MRMEAEIGEKQPRAKEGCQPPEVGTVTGQILQRKHNPVDTLISTQ